LRCEGSSLFLKSKFGAGYTLTLVKDDASVKLKAIFTNFCKDEEAIVQTVTEAIPDCKILSTAAKEISFQLPKHSSKQFPSLFSALDANK
jgi:ATP-binding cassette subfamily A (ABC1) protein 3